MGDKMFSRGEKDKAEAFVKAFGGGKVIKEASQPREFIPKAEVKPSEPENITPKVNIGAEYTARRKMEEELDILDRAEKKSGNGFFSFIIFLIALGALIFAFYNYNSLIGILEEQEHILSNQKVLFDKLARIGKRLRL